MLGIGDVCTHLAHASQAVQDTKDAGLWTSPGKWPTPRVGFKVICNAETNLGEGSFAAVAVTSGTGQIAAEKTRLLQAMP